MSKQKRDYRLLRRVVTIEYKGVHMEHTHIAKDGTVYTHTHEAAHEHGHSHSHPHHHKNTKAVLNRMNLSLIHILTFIFDRINRKTLVIAVTVHS